MDHSGLAKSGIFRIAEIGILQDWQNWESIGLAKSGPLQKLRNSSPSKLVQSYTFCTWSYSYYCKKKQGGGFFYPCTPPVSKHGPYLAILQFGRGLEAGLFMVLVPGSNICYPSYVIKAAQKYLS